MKILRFLPVVLSLLLLAAHCLRTGIPLLWMLPFVLGTLLFVPRPWARRAVQVGLLLGAAEWLRTLGLLVLERRALGQPFLRLALILGGVALFTGFSAALLRGKAPGR